MEWLSPALSVAARLSLCAFGAKHLWYESRTFFFLVSNASILPNRISFRDHRYAADIQKKGAAAATRDALAHLHAESREFILHVDTDIIAQEEFPAVNVPGSGGLTFDDVRQSLREVLSQKTLLGLDVAQYNPDRDLDGSGAQKLVELLVDALAARFEALSTPQESAVSEANQTVNEESGA